MSHIKQIQQNLGMLDALILTDPISIRYASGFYITDGAAVIARDKAFFITDSRYIEAAERAVTDMTVLCFTPQNPMKTILRDILSQGGYAAPGAEENRLSHGEWTRFEKLLGCSLQNAGSILSSLRASKDSDEIRSMTAAQRIAEKALDEVCGILRPGMSEKELAAELVYRLYKHGGEANSFDPIVITGAKTSMPHGVPGSALIADGDFVTMDFGTMFNGYCSDMTRTVAVGHATQEMKDIYSIVLEAQLAGIDAARPGVSGKAVDAAARKVIEDAGYGSCFGHSFGHSLGLEIHESPNAAPSNHDPLPEGAVISAEPGIYIPGKFGVRIEDVIWLRDGGAENLTKAPKNLLIV